MIFVHIKMIYNMFHRQELYQKANARYHNCRDEEKAAEYYIAITDVIKKSKK